MSVTINPFGRPISSGPEPLTSPRRPVRSAPNSGAGFLELLAAMGQEQEMATKLTSFASTGTLGRERSALPDEVARSNLRTPEVSTGEARASAGLSSDEASSDLRLDAQAGDHGADGSIPVRSRPPHPRLQTSAPPDFDSVGAKPTAMEDIAAPFWFDRPITDSKGSPPGRAVREFPGRGVDERSAAIAVFVETADDLFRVRVRLPACDPSERERLKTAAAAVLAEYDAPQGDVIIHETGGTPAALTRRR